MEIDFGEAIKAVQDGKRVTMIDWEVNYQTRTDDDGVLIEPPKLKPTYLKRCYTNEPEINNDGDFIINQPFIARFIYNGGYIVQPYNPTQYDIMAGRFIILD